MPFDVIHCVRHDDLCAVRVQINLADYQYWVRALLFITSLHPIGHH